MITVTVRYFAVLREQRGIDHETVATAAATPAALYAELQVRHGFSLASQRLRTALNGDFAAWDAPLHDGDDVVYLPPAAGG